MSCLDILTSDILERGLRDLQGVDLAQSSSRDPGSTWTASGVSCGLDGEDISREGGCDPAICGSIGHGDVGGHLDSTLYGFVTADDVVRLGETEVHTFLHDV